jgi:hypothetical protein
MRLDERIAVDHEEIGARALTDDTDVVEAERPRTATRCGDDCLTR